MNSTIRFYIAGLLLLSIFTTGCQSAPTQSSSIDLRVMSFNIRNGRAKDGDNDWNHRKPLVYGVILDDAPDFVGVQEAFRFQMDELAQNLPDYGEIGEARNGGTEDEYSAILYRRDRFEVAQSGTFWLSDTPEVVSKTWGHYHHRICTWGRFIDKRSGLAFYVYNTHFDHQSQKARVNSAKLIADRIAARTTQDPVILTGDFNAGEDNPVIKYLKGERTDAGQSPIPLVDTFRQVYPDATLVGTGNGGYKGRKDTSKIDYVFVLPGTQTLDAGIDQDPRDGRYPSDHYPVTATIRLMR